MKSITTAAIAAASLALANASPIVMPPTTEKGTEIAIVWIHGADCDNEAYQSIAAEVQAEAAKKN